MSKFKVGDRVKVIGVNKSDPLTGNEYIKDGMFGTIIVIENSEPKIGVEFDDCINGHSLHGVGAENRCWFMYTEELKKVGYTKDRELDQLCLTLEKAMNRLYEIADSYTMKQAANGIINILQRKSVDRLELNRFKKALEDNHNEDM